MALKSNTQHNAFSKRSPLVCVLVLVCRKPCLLMSFLEQQVGMA